MIAVAFSCGLALGVVVGAALWSAAQYIARGVASAEHRKQLALYRQQVMADKARFEKARSALKIEFGDQLTKEQERMMEAELSTIFRTREHPDAVK